MWAVINIYLNNIQSYDVVPVCLFKDRVVDDLNPVLNFTRKEVESLLHFVEEEPDKISLESRGDFEIVMYTACQLYPHLITKVQLHDRRYLKQA